MLFLGGKSIGFATNHTLEVNSDLQDVSSKDFGAGDWSSQEVGLLSWTASSENFYSLDAEGEDFASLFDIMIAKTPVEAVFCKKSQADSVTQVPTGGWTPQAASASTPQYVGNVVISSLSLNAQNGEYSSYSVQFQGIGKLEKKTTV